MPVTIVDERALATGAVRGTVLFADLRGYTTLAERLSPMAVVALLEEFLAVLADAIELQGGTIFHSAGDSIMAGFGLADVTAEPGRRAIAASRRIVATFAPLASRWERRYGTATGVGVGLHLGDMALAELGPAPVRRRTLIGDTVNVAARLCQRARAGEVLFSGPVAECLEGPPADGVITLPDFTVRGRETPVRIFCVPARERITLAARPPGEPLSPPHAAA